MKDRAGPWVGRPIDRVDGRAKVTGAAVYAAEVPVANVAYGVIVGSAIARGTIRSIDLGVARAAPGVLAVLAPGATPALPGAKEKGPQDRALQLLQDDQIHYADQPISADELGVPLSRVRFELGDTAYPEAPLSAGSFTASSAGSAVKLACAALRRRLAELAVADPTSPLHGAAPDDLAAEDGALYVRRDPTRREAYAAIVRKTGAPEGSARYTTQIGQDHERRSMHSFGAVFAEVRVDEQLGIVRVARLVGAYAAGRILNAKTARSQLIGGLVWAIGMGLTEESVRDPRTGRMVTRDLGDYHVPVNADVPDLDVIFVDEHDPYVNEIGAKGIGEIGNTGAHAAIASAVFHATGRRIRDLPIRLDKVMGG